MFQVQLLLKRSGSEMKNFTGTISVAGNVGGNTSAPDAGSGAGGGGAGGMGLILYKTATSTAGTINTAGGAGGNNTAAGGSGGASDNILVTPNKYF